MQMKKTICHKRYNKHGEKDDKNDEAMVNKALEDLDHLSQQTQ